MWMCNGLKIKRKRSSALRAHVLKFTSVCLRAKRKREREEKAAEWCVGSFRWSDALFLIELCASWTTRVERERERGTKRRRQKKMSSRMKFCLLSGEVDYLFFIKPPEDEERGGGGRRRRRRRRRRGRSIISPAAANKENISLPQ